MGGSLQKVIFYSILVIICHVYSQTCPDVTHLITAEGNSSVAPEGFFVYGIYDQNGLYISKTRDYSPVVLPHTKSDVPTDIAISSNGKWVLYNTGGTPYLVRLSPGCKIKIPLAIDSTSHVGFWRNQPNGEEAICYMVNFYTIRALTLHFEGDTVLFGNDRLILSFNDSLWIRPAMRLCISADQLFNPLYPLIEGSHAAWHTAYITLPDYGMGIASPANIYKWSEPFDHKGGCAHAMSWDGTLCAADLGMMSASPCLPHEHKGFTITPFWRDTAAPQTMENSMSYAISMNWCPERFRLGAAIEQNFWDWYFGNSNEYVIGNQLGNLAEIHGIWLVRWRDNNWTLLTDPINKIEAYLPAVHFCKMDTVEIDTSQIADTSSHNDDPYDPHFRIISPNGGEVYYLGDSLKVRLYSEKSISASVSFTIDGGLKWKLLVNSSVDPISDTMIQVPLTFNKLGLDSTNTGDLSECMVMIQDYGTGRFTDYSDSFFTIRHSRPNEPDNDHGTGCGRGVSNALLPIVIIKLTSLFKSGKGKKKREKI